MSTLMERIYLAGLTGPALEAGRRWLAGKSAADVGQPLGLTNRKSVYSWAQRAGLPARQHHPRLGARPVGALSHTGKRVHNAANFRRKVAA